MRVTLPVTLSVTPRASLAVFTGRRLAPWLLIGAGASLLELVLLRLLHDGAGWPLPLASAVAAETLIVAKFLASDRCVFGYRWPTGQRLLRYHGACAGAFVAYWLVINALALLLAVPYVVGFVAGTAVAFTWSLLTNFLWVWAPSR